MTHVVAPTLAVAGTWFLICVLLFGCGFLLRSALTHGRLPPRSRLMPDAWIGLAAACAYLQLWSLFLPIGRTAWIAPAAAGMVGVSAAARGLVRRAKLRRAPVPVAAAGVALATLWIANRALGAATDYDLGLYHLSIIRYATNYAVIPGLAHLDERFGASDPNLLFGALLSHGPWAGGGVHLVNGLFGTLLLWECGSRCFGRAANPAFTRRFALLILLSTIVVVGIDPGGRVSSPNLDFATYVFVAAGLLYLAEAVEDAPSPTAIVASLAILTLAAVTRPLYWSIVVTAIGFVVLANRRFTEVSVRRAVRPLAPAALVPIGLVAGWMARQVFLSGYPFFPVPVLGLSADWRVSADTIKNANRWIASWAREPGLPPDRVLDSWHWLSGWWAPTHSNDLNVMVPLAVFLFALVLAVIRQRMRATPSARETFAMAAVVVPSALTLVAWFLLAPDPRFALAPIWLLPAAIAAWAMGTSIGRDRFTPRDALLVGLLGLGFFVCGRESVRLLPIFAVALAVALLGANARRRTPSRPVLAGSALIAIFIGALALTANRGSFDIVSADGHGTFGAASEPEPVLVTWQTRSGLALRGPKSGDQCWGALFCTPYRNPNLELRGSTWASGFRVDQ